MSLVEKNDDRKRTISGRSGSQKVQECVILPFKNEFPSRLEVRSVSYWSHIEL